MNCTEARELFDMHLDGALEPTVSASVKDHLQGCSSCQAAYRAMQVESQLLKQALQAEVSSATEIARIEARVRKTVRPEGHVIADLGEWAVPVLGTVLGLLALVGGRFDGAAVRDAVCLSLNPRGGLPVAIPSVLVVALVILTVITLQSFIFRTGEQD